HCPPYLRLIIGGHAPRLVHQPYPRQPPRRLRRPVRFHRHVERLQRDPHLPQNVHHVHGGTPRDPRHQQLDRRRPLTPVPVDNDGGPTDRARRKRQVRPQPPDRDSYVRHQVSSPPANAASSSLSVWRACTMWRSTSGPFGGDSRNARKCSSASACRPPCSNRNAIP